MKIIGQKKLLTDIDNLILNNNFPRYSIICGVEGSGKKLISAYIANRLNATLAPCDLSVNSVREVIDLSYTQTSPTVYMWANANGMSINAKNAVLKVTEEPPQNAYFIMTTDNINGLLGTLISRGTVFNINPYSVNELEDYANIKLTAISDEELHTILNISTTPKDIIDLSTIDINKFNLVVKTLCDRVGKVNLANELKIPTFLKFKDTDEDKTKFDPILFMKACSERFLTLMKTTNKRIYANYIQLTSSYLADMYSKSLNKIATVDSWIIDLHETALRG